MAQKLTDKTVKALSGKPRILFDDSLSGFGVRLTKSAAKTFMFDYRVNGRQRRYTIGKYPAWSVRAARDEAGRLRHVVDTGGDPLGNRNAMRNAPTVTDLAERYMDEHARPKKRPASADGDQYLIDRFIKPEFGRRKVASITYADVDRLHRKVSTTAPTTANRVVALLSKMFSLSIRWQYRADNPATGIERNQEKKRRRYLSGDELRRLTQALNDYPCMETVRLSRAQALETGSRSAWRRREAPDTGRLQSCNVIRLLLLTGARKGETLRAKWSQIDFDNGTWTKPGATTKQKTDHRIPLSAPALKLLSDMTQDSDYVFPGESGHQKDIKGAWAALCEMAEIEDCRIHDLRHTYASQLASAGLSLPVIGALLGHTQPQTTARYSHLFDDPLREATERVGAIVSASSRGANVIDLGSLNRG